MRMSDWSSDVCSSDLPFIRKYIFPGTDVPTLGEVLPVIEDAMLIVNDVEVLRLHYAETLRHWEQRFQANRAKIAALYAERFCRKPGRASCRERVCQYG